MLISLYTCNLFLSKLHSKYTVPAANAIRFPKLVFNVFHPHTPVNTESVVILPLWQHRDLNQPHAIFSRLHL